VAKRPLHQAVRDPGFTPSVRDLGALVAMLADEDVGKDAERALARLGNAAVEGLVARMGEAPPPLRAKIARALGRLAGDARAVAALVEALGDADPKTRRNAAIALGQARGTGEEESAGAGAGVGAGEGADVEAALLAAWERDARPEMRRSVAASLGKVGSARSAGLLDEAARSDDAELARIAQRARLMVERTGSRAARGRVAGERAPLEATDVLLVARAGLEEVVAEQAAGVDALAEVRIAGPGRVRARLAGPLEGVFGVRSMLAARFPLPTEMAQGAGGEEAAVARAIAGELARRVLARWTDGAPRYRIAWAAGGHKRAAVWRVAAEVARRAPELVNDPTASLWEAVVESSLGVVDVSLEPRALPDPRFAWRRGDVPAASHPTIAAALAHVAGARPDDVVWDPFVGSGGELVERARLGGVRALHGSDLDPRALEVARANLAAAGVAAELRAGDALALPPPAGLSLVVTNPPMGRRAVRAPELPAMLDRFVARVAAALVPGGRLVWIAPWPARARASAERAGLRLDRARALDMGGFDAELQRWSRE